MTRTALRHVVDLVGTPAQDSGWRVGLEMIEGGTGRLRANSEIDVDDPGVEFHAGDILFGKLRPYLAKVWLADRSGGAVGDIHVYRPNPYSDARFLAYAILDDTFIHQVAASTHGAKMPRASWNTIKQIQVPAPPLAQQRRIANFLDRETAQVDKLIKKQESLIEQLRDRKTAAVLLATQNWGGYKFTPTRCRFLCNVETGSGDTINSVEEGSYPFYVRSDTPVRSDEWEFDGPAVLTAGDGAGVGKVFHLVDGRFMAHQRVYVMRDFKWVLPSYFYYAFSARFAEVALDGSAKSTVDSVRRAMITDLVLPIPEVPVQEEVVHHLDGKMESIDQLISKAEQFIELAQERRAALITAAVTGQLDITSKEAA